MSTIVAETDFLIGLIHPRDKLHNKCVNLVENYRVYLSPYSLLEYRLINVSEKEFEKWIKIFKLIDSILKYFGIDILPSNPLIHMYSMEYRSSRGLSLFDSLHAGVAKFYRIPLTSSDKVYADLDIEWLPLK